MSLSARDFIRFQPDGANSIWVTLGIIHWYTVGTAEQDLLGNWSITSDATTTPPAGPNSSDELPVWRYIVHSN